MTIHRFKQQDVHVNRNTKTLHIETELGIVNIYLGLHDVDGRLVESITISGDRSRGELHTLIDGQPGSYATTVRLVQETEAEQHARERKVRDER